MNKKKIFLIIILLLIIVAEIVAIFFVLPKSGDSNNSNNVVVDEDYYKNIDITNELDDRYDLPAEDYYKKYYKIIDTIKADKSKKLMTVSEVKKLLEERGFKKYQLSADFSVDGDIVDEDIEDNLNGKYPTYSVIYASANNEIWVINIIDNSIYAYPSSYMLDHGRTITKTIIISEKTDMVTYDVLNNVFYYLKPNKNILDYRVIDKIDAKTIDSYVIE